MLRLDDLPSPPAGRRGWPWTEAPALPPEAGDRFWPRVTILTPSLDQGAFLEEAIRSVLLQGYPNLEYAVLDGGSTDGSRELLERYRPFLDDCRIGPDGGQARALNGGFSRATGEIFGFLNSDDVYEPGALFALAQPFRAGARWVVGEARYLRAGVDLGPVRQQSGSGISEWFWTCPVCQPAALWSAVLHGAVGPLREDLAVFFDYDFWMRMRFRHREVPHRIDRWVARYRLHEDSMTTTRRARFQVEASAIRSDYWRDLSSLDRVRARVGCRRVRARHRGGRAIAMMLEGEWGHGMKTLAAALRLWPPVALEPATAAAIVNRLRRPRAPDEIEVWPDWDFRGPE